MNSLPNPLCNRYLAGWIAVCGLAAAVPAFAQNALDHSLSATSGRVNPSRPDFAAEVRFRNAIVTGNVPGGMSFRGDAGYRAPSEITANLGSNDLFAFRRDSLYSGLGGMGIRGTDALQYQIAATTGNTPPPGIGYGFGVVNRSGSGVSSGTVAPASGTPRKAEVTAIGLGVEAIENGSVGAVRSPASFIATRDLRPVYMGQGYDEKGQPRTVSISPLRGISFDEMAGKDLSTRDASFTGLPRESEKPDKPVDDKVKGAPRPGQDQPIVAPPAGPRQLETRIDDKVNTALDTKAPYDDLMARMRQAELAKAAEEAKAAGREAPPSATPDDQARAGWDRRLDELRGTLKDTKRTAGKPGDRSNQNAPGPTGSTGPSGPSGTAGDLFRPGNASQPPRGATGAETGRATPKGGETPAVPADLARLLRSTKEEARTLAPPGFDPYSQSMKIGQDHLQGGRYFDAEERFTTALSVKPGDPMAAAGRVNAEIGAGMFLSAGLNLKSLLTEHPEMVGVKFARELLPAPERMPLIIGRLQDLLGDPAKAADAALLLAYVGYQTGDQAAVRKGLDAMVGTADQDERNRRLGEVLREVWVEGGATPKPAPEAPPEPTAPAAPVAPK